MTGIDFFKSHELIPYKLQQLEKYIALLEKSNKGIRVTFVALSNWGVLQ